MHGGKRKRISAGVLVSMVAFLLLASIGLSLTAPAAAQSGGGFDLTWWSVDCGGTTFSEGGGYTLGGTIGQADPGLLTGGGYSLGGGFWGGGAVTVMYTIYVPLVMRNTL